MKKYCAKCGGENNASDSKCFKCGFPLQDKDVAAALANEPPVTRQPQNIQIGLDNEMSSFSQGILILVWIGACCSAAIGGLIILSGMAAAQSAPQEASVCAFGLSWAIIPYCIARGVTEMVRSGNK